MRIETWFADSALDGRANGIVARLGSFIPAPSDLRMVDVVLADFSIPRDLVHELFVDPVVQVLASSPAPEELGGWDWLVETSFRPGVTDTLAITIREALAIAGVVAGTVQTSRLFLLGTGGRTMDRDGVQAAFAPLWNPLIQSCLFVSRADWTRGDRLPDLYPSVSLEDPAEPALIDIASLDDMALEALSTRRLLALSLPEMRAISAFFALPGTVASRAAAGLPREATDVELEMLAQTWSEHCKHKIFNADIEYVEALGNGKGKRLRIASLFKTYIKSTTTALAPSRPDLLSVFTDNAGVFKFDDDYAICVKAETHNSPSALDPYGGAITGIVGVNRDILGTGIGAAPLFNTDVLCFAHPATPDASVPAGLKKPRDLLEGVHRGIVDGGNQSGIPNAGGAFVFDPSFLGKPLVFCGTGGIMPLVVRGRPSWEKRIEAGMLAVMVGGRVGKDGIHGATFSSLALDEGSPVSAVQIGDPIIQRKMSDFLLEARDAGLYQGITDNGAGGLSSSLGEMATACGGIRIDLDACPRKYPGLSPWEVLVSESQERMSLAVLPESLPGLLDLAQRRGVEAAVVGAFTASGSVEISSGGKPVGLLPLDFLHDGLPVMDLAAIWNPATVTALPPVGIADLGPLFLKVLADPDVASKEALVRQYDHEVKAISIEKPFTGVERDAPSDGCVVKPRFDSWRGLAIGHGIAVRVSACDPGLMASAAVDEAYRAYIALGGEPDAAVALDNFCWPDPVAGASNPGGERKLAGLVRACAALKEACLAYGLPLVSGKDSMKNDSAVGGKRISVKPTLLVTVVGPVADVRKCPSTDFMSAGDLVYLVGSEGRAGLGASIFERVLDPSRGFNPGSLPGDPSPDLPFIDEVVPCEPRRLAAQYRLLARAISGRMLRSIHDLSDGGLAVALAESCLGGRLGAEIRLDGPAARLGAALGKHALAAADLAARLLFSEAPGRLLVSIRPEDRERFEGTMAGSMVLLLGRSTADARLRASLGGQTLLDADLPHIEAAWKTPILPRGRT